MSWAVLRESVAGTAHRGKQTPCQDAVVVRCFGPENAWLVIAAADGAGTALHAETGAKLACDGFARHAETVGPEALATRDGVTTMFAAVRDEILAEAARRGVPAREFACTALLAVVGPESATVAQIGDGAVVLGDGDGYRVAFWPDPAGYANATDFLTDDGFADTLLFETFPGPVREIAVLTDGLQRLALDFTTRTPHAAFFRPLFHALRAAADPEALADPFRGFLDSPRVNDRTDDDKTLAIAARRP